ncbi:MAG: hypothetical protein Unbinned2902contig1001_14 [Prokaryotic dsDNA virus sp.]|nr:MAG: hypothetical protein Unbinned2902contig1001_14 [Prokaryotic dsDNA virus sp.]|tara:strand:- start:7861 stop:11481 length:3621 start_codon:yes stop_codon:yes gene_type:complete
MRRRHGLRKRRDITQGPTISEKLGDQTHALMRPPTAITKSYGASGDLWDLLRYGSPTVLLTKGLITPDQYKEILQTQFQSEDPLPRYEEERQELIKGPLPIKPMEEPSVEFLSELFADPSNILLGGIGMAGMTAKNLLSKATKKSGIALNRVFGKGEPPFLSGPAIKTQEIVSDLTSKGNTQYSTINSDTGEILVNIDWLKSKMNEHYGKKHIEYSGYEKFLNDKLKEGKKKISLNDVEDHWAKNNLDITESWVSNFDSQYSIPGGENQRTLLISYNGKQKPITKETLERLNGISNKKFGKNFSDLDKKAQSELEKEYKTWYPDDLTIDPPDPGNRFPFEDDNTKMHHGRENILFHLRMDDRIGVGDQSGEKILNVFEIQSDWYQRANREGVYNLENYDNAISELNHKIKLLEQQKNINKTPEEIAGILHQQEQLKAKISEQEQLKAKIFNEMSDENAAPKVPFMSPGKGNEWVELALKRILKLAVDEGYDRVSFGTRQIQNELYGGVHTVDHIKVKKMKRSDEFILPKKSFNPDGTVNESSMKTSGDNFPYYVEAFDKNGNKIEHQKGKNFTVNYFSKDNLINTFGKNLTNVIENKAKHGKLLKIIPDEHENIDIGMENLRVHYEVLIPSLLKKQPFKKFKLKVEKTSMGNTVTPAEIVSLNESFRMRERYLSDRGIYINDQGGGEVTFTFTNTEGKEITAPIEGLLASAQEGRLVAPPGGIDYNEIRDNARIIQERLELGVQGPFVDLPDPNIHSRNITSSARERTERLLHPNSRNATAADASSMLERNGIYYDMVDGELIFNVDESAPLQRVTPDVYTSSGQYLHAVRAAGGHPTDIPEEVRAMRELEIKNVLDGLSDFGEGVLVDNQFLNLMNPETRQVELTHINNTLANRNIKTIFVENGKIKFNWADSPSADKWSADEMLDARGASENLYNLMRRLEVAGDPSVDKYEVLNLSQAEQIPFHIEMDIHGVIGDDLGSRQQLLAQTPVPHHLSEPIDTSLSTQQINFQEVMNDIRSSPPNSNDLSRSNAIFNSLEESTQNDLTRLQDYATHFDDVFDIKIDYSANTPAFIAGNNSYTAEGITDISVFEHLENYLEGYPVDTFREKVEEVVIINEEFRRKLRDTELNNQDIQIGQADLTEAPIQDSYYRKPKRGSDFMQWSVKLNDKLKKELSDGPFPYSLIPPGLLAGEALRQQNQQQSLLE